MRSSTTGFIFFSLGVVAAIAACHPDETQPVVAPMNNPSATAGTYVPPAPTTTSTVPQPGTTPTAPAAGGLAVPGPMAFPCSTDAQCGLHRCNMQYSKCAFPCATDADCASGSSCVGGGQPIATCVPKMGGQ